MLLYRESAGEHNAIRGDCGYGVFTLQGACLYIVSFIGRHRGRTFEAVIESGDSDFIFEIRFGRIDIYPFAHIFVCQIHTGRGSMPLGIILPFKFATIIFINWRLGRRVGGGGRRAGI